MDVTTLDSPPGPFTVITGDDGAVLASGWTEDRDRLVTLISPALMSTSLREAHGRPTGHPSRATGHPSRAAEAARAYFDGDLHRIDDVPVRFAGSPFLDQVWKVLRDIPAGQPVSYAELATLAGRPAAVRAAGTACGRNPAALFVPCHRVLRTGGGLGGFGWGLPVKEWLLSHEGFTPTRSFPAVSR